MFTTNLHSIDRIIRLVLGIFMLSLVFVGPESLFGYVGLILIVTAFINFCPLYRVLNFSTKSSK